MEGCIECSRIKRKGSEGSRTQGRRNKFTKNTSDSEIIKLRARQIELQTSLDKVQQEFYSYGADISRTEQELSAKKERVSEINETISEFSSN